MPATSLSIPSWSRNGCCATPTWWAPTASSPAPTAAFRRRPPTAPKCTPPWYGRNSRRWARARDSPAASCNGLPLQQGLYQLGIERLGVEGIAAGGEHPVTVLLAHAGYGDEQRRGAAR